MDALQAAMRPIASLLNRNILAMTPARELCAELDGKTVAVRVQNTGLVAYFTVHDELLELSDTSDQEPDLTISGSLINLARLAGTSDESAVRDRSIDLSGDAETAQQFQQLLKYARPDIEEELSGLVGDVAAHRLGEIARGIGQWGRDARKTMGANIREYLQEESRTAPSRYELDSFSSEIRTLRDDVDRLEVRLKRLRDFR